ncbi:hypothetical protein [Peribacillus frigoritolerans]|uniref:hypothetical protein n=1 Tax=Peribacillus frigoritolerans TaxID=450367 RepID=UPI00301933AE|nr:hypothetical protein KY492_11570 [Brevibacterium sp. PAMC21349]
MGIVNLPYWGWMIGAFFLGFISSGESVPYGFILQSETPKQIMGRVSAVTTIFYAYCTSCGISSCHLAWSFNRLDGSRRATCFWVPLFSSLFSKE